jgi:hypothetical protein
VSRNKPLPTITEQPESGILKEMERAGFSQNKEKSKRSISLPLSDKLIKAKNNPQKRIETLSESLGELQKVLDEPCYQIHPLAQEILADRIDQVKKNEKENLLQEIHESTQRKKDRLYNISMRGKSHSENSNNSRGRSKNRSNQKGKQKEQLPIVQEKQKSPKKNPNELLYPQQQLRENQILAEASQLHSQELHHRLSHLPQIPDITYLDLPELYQVNPDHLIYQERQANPDQIRHLDPHHHQVHHPDHQWQQQHNRTQEDQSRLSFHHQRPSMVT